MYMYICIYIIAACLQIAVDGGGGRGADACTGKFRRAVSLSFGTRPLPLRGVVIHLQSRLFSSQVQQQSVFLSSSRPAVQCESSSLSVTSHVALLTILKQHLRSSLKARAVQHVGRPARRCIRGSAKRLREGKSATVPGAHSILSTLPRILPS